LGIDGEVGPLTTAAVRQFQLANKLGVNGLLDPGTLKELNDLLPANHMMLLAADGDYPHMAKSYVYTTEIPRMGV
jgi:peptidoglycan hydrolase-like protein with peptidoglycan-binding domain